jgi:hypothetical protein
MPPGTLAGRGNSSRSVSVAFSMVSLDQVLPFIIEVVFKAILVVGAMPPKAALASRIVLLSK